MIKDNTRFPMDFKRFKDSAFLHFGHSRFDYTSGYNFIQRDAALYETSSFFGVHHTNLDKFNEDEYIPSGFAKSLTLCHLKNLLSINDPLFLDFAFKKEITRQWIEVNAIIESLNQKPKFSMLVISEPGVAIPKHVHNVSVKQTLTFCYTFHDEKNNVFDNSCFIVGKNEERQVNFPNSDKFYFTFLDRLPHGLCSNEWNFFWSYDYSDYVDLPKESDIDFIYLPI
jgi:hypothetical protein